MYHECLFSIVAKVVHPCYLSHYENVNSLSRYFLFDRGSNRLQNLGTNCRRLFVSPLIPPMYTTFLAFTTSILPARKLHDVFISFPGPLSFPGTSPVMHPIRRHVPYFSYRSRCINVYFATTRLILLIESDESICKQRVENI